MDLLTMGYSVRDIGNRLRWSDIRAIVRNLPPDSNLRRQQNPDDHGVHSITDQLLTLVVDAVRRLPYIQSGQVDMAPPPLLQTLQGGGDSGGEPEDRESRRPALTSASAVRDRIAALRNR